ncbi:Acyl-CoA dehydrogenase, short-chain specific [Delftia tsuruhatensis]|uniref:acyl-CoA dehydrogenase family protein n=1 Tax=Delftia tsuruhatensis TaxID=180282 RepID=UPI001E6FD15F|nr:acyl-CoA dehydrogenase family protein [Delftia tsuruhatensis]CAB5670949.1 Acyl-CoA dehydrogenase, short-chain specific [Delftia tsuruhatensis]CAC9683113.1 Acyl-CoA dehydrogenase, short-chain specific [Delftia tsuruhatensis]
MHGIFEENHFNLRQKIAEYAKENILKIRNQIEDNESIPQEIYQYLANSGWYGITIPEKYKGMEAGHLARFIAIEEISRISGAVGGCLQSAILGTAMVQNHGSAEQKDYWLPRFAQGKDIISICITEPNSGSHILGMNTTARREKDEYVLDGVKCWIANSHVASVHGVIAKTNNSSGKLSAFLVEADRPGFRTGQANDNTGLRGLNLGEVIFENCRIPAINRVGDEGDGLKIAHSSITHYGKPNLTAVALGIHSAIMEDTIAYAKNRKIYGKSLANVESVRLKIASIYKNLHLARQSAYCAMKLLDANASADESIILAKLVGTELAFESAKAALDIFAARGGSRSIPIERYMRDLLMLFPPAGTSDVQLKRLAEIALKEYRESTAA